MVLVLQAGKEASKGEEELDDSRTSMPVQARPCPSGVETSKHAGHVLALWVCVHLKVCELSSSVTTPNQSLVPTLLAKKKTCPLYFYV